MPAAIIHSRISTRSPAAGLRSSTPRRARSYPMRRLRAAKRWMATVPTVPTPRRILAAAKEPGLPIEQAFKRVRFAVNGATNKQQLPWESSSLTSDFSFFPGRGRRAARVTQASVRPTGAPSARAASRSVDAWKNELQRRPAPEAYEIVIRKTPWKPTKPILRSTQAPDSARVRAVFDRRRIMIAWYTAVLDTPASYQAFWRATATRILRRRRGACSSAHAIEHLGVPKSRASVPACNRRKRNRNAPPDRRTRESRAKSTIHRRVLSYRLQSSMNRRI